MDGYQLLETLLDLAEQVGLTVRQASGTAGGDHPGGAVVRLKGADVLFLDPTAGVADQVAVAALALRGRAELQQRYLPPEVRDAIEATE